MLDLSFDRNAIRAKDDIEAAVRAFSPAALPQMPMRPAGNLGMPPRPQGLPPAQGMGMQPPMAQGALSAMARPAPAAMPQPLRPQMMARPPMAVRRFAKGGGAWTRKEGQNPEGGLNAKGRASLRAQGHDIKPPVSAKQAKKSPKAAARRKSFCARMSGMPGPMKDEKGRPTRKALSLRKWDC